MDINTYKDTIIEILDNLNDVDIIHAAAAIERAGRDGWVYVCGNGGSAATANHMAVDLLKACGIKTISLCDNMPIITAYGNDDGYEHAFSHQLKQYNITPKDVLVAISASGNSPNIITAMRHAKDRYATIVGLLGFDGGDAKYYADISVIVPSFSYEQVEDIHLMIVHMIKQTLMV